MIETHRYTRDGLTVVWKPRVCMHAKKCWKELPEVFDPSRRPWVDLSGAELERIRAQVQACPSGALSLESAEEPAGHEQTATTIEVMPNGPLIVSGPVTLKRGEQVEQKAGKTALCRCGQSKNKPLCDGTHRTCGFVG